MDLYSALLWSHLLGAQVWYAFSRDLSFTCTPHVHPLTEWTIPDLTFPAKAATHLPTPEGWKAELALKMVHAPQRHSYINRSLVLLRVSCWWLSSSVWRWSSSAEVSFQQHPEAARATNTQQTWRQEFLGSRSLTVERSSTRTAAAGTFLRFFQTIFENTLLCLVTLSTYRRYINECIYLSIYLPCSAVSLR